MYQSFAALGCAYQTADQAAIISIVEYVTAGGNNAREDVLETCAMSASDLVDEMLSDDWSQERDGGLTIGVSIMGRVDEDGDPEAILYDRDDLERLVDEARAEILGAEMRVRLALDESRCEDWAAGLGLEVEDETSDSAVVVLRYGGDVQARVDRITRAASRVSGWSIVE